MSERKEALLKRAAECERQAVLARDKAICSTYIELARQWRDMAQQVELLERQYGAFRNAR